MSLQDAYTLVGATNIRELHRAFVDEDQRLMKSRAWDYDNPTLLTNRIKVILADLDLAVLSEEEREWCMEMLWLWHHHAISSAVWRQKDRAQARFHAAKALHYQCLGHPNRITQLLYLLVHDNLVEAEAWAAQITDEVEDETAASILREYKIGLFFADNGLEVLKGKFAHYQNIQLVIKLIETKRATMPVSGLQARLAPGTFPLQSNLAPMLEADGVLVINAETLVRLAAKVEEVPAQELDWLNRTLRGLAEQVAKEDGTGRA